MMYDYDVYEMMHIKHMYYICKLFALFHSLQRNLLQVFLSYSFLQVNLILLLNIVRVLVTKLRATPMAGSKNYT